MVFLEKLMEVIIDEGINTPKAQVERYLSPILAIFLPDILSQKFGKKYTMIAPEFPIRKGRIEPDGTNQSTNIDYLMFNETDKKFAFIELKTDSRSFKESQLGIYHKLQEICDKTEDAFGQMLFNDLKEIHKASSQKGKYENFIKAIWKEDIYNSIDSMEIIYLVPAKNKLTNLNVLSFKDLPSVISSEYAEEWGVIHKKLLKLDDN